MPWTVVRCRWSTLPGEKPAEIIEALTDDAAIKPRLMLFLRGWPVQVLSDMGVSLDPFHDNHPLSQECAVT